MEKQIVDRLLGAFDDQRIVEFEQAIVQIPSFTTEETELARYIAQYMENIGGPLEVDLQEVPLEGGRISHNVVGKLPGTGGGPSLLFFGHLDHSPILGREFAKEELKNWTHDAFGGVIENDWLYGKGSQDEKGGITGFVMAAEALVRSDLRLKGDVYFAGVQGHKRVSSGTLHLLKQGYRFDYAINSENTGNMIVNTWVGRTEGKIHIRAKELHFHIKEIFPEYREQLTAFEMMNRIQAALGAEMRPPARHSWMSFEPHLDLPDYPQLRMEVVEFRGLHHLVLEFQIRSVPGMTDETIKADLERLLGRFEEEHPHLSTEVEWPSRTVSRPAVYTPPEHPVVQSLAHWHEKITGERGGIGALGRMGAAADGSHTAAAGIDTVLYGPGGGTTDMEYRLRAHKKQGQLDERIALADLVTTAKVFALVAADVCG